jgi:hypothetical protein
LSPKNNTFQQHETKPTKFRNQNGGGNEMPALIDRCQEEFIEECPGYLNAWGRFGGDVA